MKNNTYWTLSDRQLCDLELILLGAFNPLKSFLSRDDYESVIENMRLSDGKLWPLPITLDVDDGFVEKIEKGLKITLKDKEGFSLASLKINDIWQPDLKNEALLVYGTTDTKHPGVDYLLNIGNNNYVSGSLEKISLPRHYDF